MKTLSALSTSTGVATYEHLEAEAEVPILAGIQCQGDLIVIPIEAEHVAAARRTGGWTDVPRAGYELLRGQHPHVLVADPGVCRYTAGVRGQDLALVDASAPVYLLHPEHGGMGLVAGVYLVRRQREQAETERLVAD